MPGPISKTERSALETILKTPTAAKSMDESTVASLKQRGMIREKMGITQVTARGKIDVQRRGLLRGRKK
jgi:hypothetical protein